MTRKILQGNRVVKCSSGKRLTGRLNVLDVEDGGVKSRPCFKSIDTVKVAWKSWLWELTQAKVKNMDS